jgi:glycerol-3-phosphate acyltransferase PlsY
MPEMNRWLIYLLAGIIAYCLGSVSTGILVSRWMHGPDLRTVGSKNTGASNVQRTMGWKYGLITFFADALKGVLACLIAELLTLKDPYNCPHGRPTIIRMTKQELEKKFHRIV